MTLTLLSAFSRYVIQFASTPINSIVISLRIKLFLTPLGFKRLRGDFKRYNSHRVYAALRTSEHLLRSS